MNENLVRKHSGPGIAVSVQTQENVLLYYKTNNGLKPLKDIIDDCEKLFGVKRKRFYKIIKFGITAPKIKRERDPKYNFTCEDYNVIDNIIIDLMNTNVCPSKIDVFRQANSIPDCHLSFKKCSRSAFYRILKRMKYKFGRTDELIRQEIIQTPRIQRKIIDYLIEKKRLEDEIPGRLFVYIDETPVYVNYVNKRVLQVSDLNCDKVPKTHKMIGNGKRFSVIHAGSEDGFVEGALLITENNIESEIFEHWLDALCQRLPVNSVVILDNASYHSRQYNNTPNTSNTKEEIKIWLETNRIDYKNMKLD